MSCTAQAQIRKNNHEIENYSWGVLQDMIEKEINSAFKLKEPSVQMPSKREIKNIIRNKVLGYREKKTNDEK